MFVEERSDGEPETGTAKMVYVGSRDLSWNEFFKAL
jgi:hypothetical protein